VRSSPTLIHRVRLTVATRQLQIADWAPGFYYTACCRPPTNGSAPLSAYSDSERLQTLNLQSLELRRIHHDLTLSYQIVFGLSVLKCHEFFQLSGRSTTRGHRFQLTKQQCRGYRRHFFTTRVVNIWNFLPKDVVSFSTLCSFKNSLNSVDFSRFLLFN